MRGLESEEFAENFNVSRETIERLKIYERLTQKWNPVINLVSKSTVDAIWARHFWDSTEVFQAAQPSTGKWVDIGSGGGFPGIVVALLAVEKSPELEITCIEADIRKCEFLRTVARTTGIKVKILTRRIEETPNQNADYISARALAPLSKLIGLIEKHLNQSGHAYLHKGENWEKEVEEARGFWKFDLEVFRDDQKATSTILKIGNIVGA